MIPQAAIGTDQGLKYVLVVNDQDVVEYRPIELGPEQPGGMQAVIPIPMYATEHGLRPVEISPDGTPNVPAGTQTIPSIDANSRIIVSGLQRAKQGRKVQVTEVPIETDAPSTSPSPAAKTENKPQQTSVDSGDKPNADKAAPAEGSHDGKQGDAVNRPESP